MKVAAISSLSGGNAFRSSTMFSRELTPSRYTRMIAMASNSKSLMFYSPNPSDDAMESAMIAPWNRPFSMKISFVCTPATTTPAR